MNNIQRIKRNNTLKRIGLYVVLALIVAGSLYFRSWQCGELFPNASLLACMLWK